MTCRKNFYIHSSQGYIKNNDNLKIQDEPCVVVFWHGRLAIMSFIYKKLWKKQNYYKSAKVIISDHKDGEIITRIISHFGIGAIRGSTSKGATRALMEAFLQIKNGGDVIITPDGPRGPKHSVSSGPAIIALKKRLPIYALNYEISRYWQFNSWDEMILPKPFSTINFRISEPINVENMQIQDIKDKIYNTLISMAQEDIDILQKNKKPTIL